MAKAALLLDFKAVQGELLLEMKLWQLPAITADRPHGLKYRLYLGRAGKTLVRYDNETGKGDHRHLGENEFEISYRFDTLEKLLDDFHVDCERLGWSWDE